MENIELTKDVFIDRQSRTLDDLRERLFQQLDKVADGKANSFEVGATVAIAHEITSTIDKEIQVARFVGEELPKFILPTFEIIEAK